MGKIKFEIKKNITKSSFIEIELPYYFCNQEYNSQNEYVIIYGVILAIDNIILIQKIDEPFSIRCSYFIENSEVYIFDSLYTQINKNEFDEFKREAMYYFDLLLNEPLQDNQDKESDK